MRLDRTAHPETRPGPRRRDVPRGPDGEILTLPDPSARMYPKRKARLIMCVRAGLISLPDLYARYRMTADEFARDCERFDRLGIPGLRVQLLQENR
jgi:hypothetical protein